MKRRHFLRNVSLAGVGTPFLLNDMKFQTVYKKLFGYAKMAEDRVLVLIRMNGGNDGLNTVIPLSSYDNLANLRPNIIIPEADLLNITPSLALHPSMTGMKNLFDSNQMSVVQNVGYPEQNRSHFRSMDIWQSGMLDQSATTGWLGRAFDNDYPNFPAAYPNNDYPDPFAISMGYDVSATCQGLVGNFSHAVKNPFDAINVGQSSAQNDGTYWGDHMEFITNLMIQSNSYGAQVNDAANAGNTMSQLYDDDNPLAVQLRYVAQMISGGLQTKVYVLNVNGYDTHDSQVDASDPKVGRHSDLLKTLSDAIAAFQDDLNLLGINQRVAGMTFSEFGRQIASNASNGTDHGDAAPLFLFGSCLNSPVIGTNPDIPTGVPNQAGVPMDIDFRDVYASILRDWFAVDPDEIQTMFEHPVQYYGVLGACNLGIEEERKAKDNDAIVYPNPAYTTSTLKVVTTAERVHVEAFDMSGKSMGVISDKDLNADEHHISFNVSDWSAGSYLVKIRKQSGDRQVSLIKK
jgi:uncharacterized protein (DUF1501 family)